MAELLNLYDLFVNGVFGNVFLAFLGITFIFVMIAIFSKMGHLLLIYILAFWALVFFVWYLGALGLFAFLVLSIIYAALSFINWLLNRRTGGL